jgi:predicted DNA-binding protein
MKGGAIMAKDELKNRVRFSTTLDIDIEKRLKEHSKQTSIPISKIVDKALAMYLENVKQ